MFGLFASDGYVPIGSSTVVSRQGAGLGGMLLEHTLRLADERSQPAYLEASSPRSRDLYERYGFEVTMTLTLPGGPDIWPMWRDAR